MLWAQTEVMSVAGCRKEAEEGASGGGVKCDCGGDRDSR